jgi:hypothetical protein
MGRMNVRARDIEFWIFFVIENSIKVQNLNENWMSRDIFQRDSKRMKKCIIENFIVLIDDVIKCDFMQI